MPRMFLDWDAWDAAQQRQLPATEATETLEELDARLREEHRDARHDGRTVQWKADLAGIYCADCLDSGYHFSFFPFKDFVRLIDGPDSDEELPISEISFIQRD